MHTMARAKFTIFNQLNQNYIKNYCAIRKSNGVQGCGFFRGRRKGVLKKMLGEKKF